MLTALSIKNFALIDFLEIDFSDKLSVITGETGSGKSILLGALGLALGKRADVTSIKNKEKKCIIEVVFDITKYDLGSFFEENDIDFESETTIRREILPSGKSRAFVNDTPVRLSVLTELGTVLIDIHSQNQTQSLNNSDFQFEIIDALAGTQELLVKYTRLLGELQHQKKNLRALEIQKEEDAKDQEYNLYLYKELVDANLLEDEQGELEQELEALTHVETIKESFDKILGTTLHDEVGVIIGLQEVQTAILKIQDFSKVYQELSDRISSVVVELDDVIKEVESASEDLVDDPRRLAVVNEKLQLIYTLQQKHKVATVTELCELRNQLEKKVLITESIDEKISEAIQEVAQATEAIQKVADKIDAKRSKVIPSFSSKVIEKLARLGMPDAQFKVDLTKVETFLINGVNQISFLFSANKGSSLGEIKKVASGGELSRVMLVVKSILANYMQLPTIIFDEIDTGVSGDVANKMGEVMQEMSVYMQVFIITHLPQVAAKGNNHYKVFKSTTAETTISELKLLTTDERVSEIAEMLSGKDVSESAIIHAKSLLE